MESTSHDHMTSRDIIPSQSELPKYSEVSAAREIHHRNGNSVKKGMNKDEDRKESLMTTMSINSATNCKVSLIPDNGDVGSIGSGGDGRPTGNPPEEREQWGRKLEFLLSVIGFAVDLGNVWRFPYICFKNGGGAFLLPYMIILIFGGVPMFYLELLIGQYHRSGCISIWKKICPMFKGIGYGICMMALYVSFYYNTIIAWSFYYLYSSFSATLPWAECDPAWSNDKCFNILGNTSAIANGTGNGTQLPAHQFFELHVLQLNKSEGLGNLGVPRWPIVLCLVIVYLILYFTLWKGVKSSGKVVWVTATFPYIVLFILLVRGLFLPGAFKGIKFYLTPQWDQLSNFGVWFDAATQVFFSLGPGFGTLIALSSYNQFNNNCHRDALVTSAVNCATSFLAGFVVFSVLGYMADQTGQKVKDVATQGPGLLFVVYGQAMTNFGGSSIFSIIFFSMLITLGLDSSFGGMESVITAFCDEFPRTIGKHRKTFVACLLFVSFLGALSTTTQGGMYVLTLLEIYATGPAIMTVVFIEAIALSWIYGMGRFCDNVREMLSFAPGIFWKISWGFVSPIFLLTMVIISFVQPPPLEYGDHKFVEWSTPLGWVITLSSMSITPAYMIYSFAKAKGTFKQRWQQITQARSQSNKTNGSEALQMNQVL